MSQDGSSELSKPSKQSIVCELNENEFAISLQGSSSPRRFSEIEEELSDLEQSGNNKYDHS